jgi:hypothetical protein
VVRGVADRVGDVDRRAPAAGAEDLERHDLRPVGQADDAAAVVRRLGDRPGAVRAVAVVVAGVGVVVDEVVAVDEVGDAQVRGGQALRALVADAGVDHGDDHAAAGGVAPGVARPDHLHVPLLPVERVVREGVARLRLIVLRDDVAAERRVLRVERVERDHEVRLGDLDERVGAQAGEQRVVLRARHAHDGDGLVLDVGAVPAHRDVGADPEALAEGLERRPVHEVDDELIGRGGAVGDRSVGPGGRAVAAGEGGGGEERRRAREVVITSPPVRRRRRAP